MKSDAPPRLSKVLALDLRRMLRKAELSYSRQLDETVVEEQKAETQLLIDKNRENEAELRQKEDRCCWWTKTGWTAFGIQLPTEVLVIYQ